MEVALRRIWLLEHWTREHWTRDVRELAPEDFALWETELTEPF